MLASPNKSLYDPSTFMCESGPDSIEPQPANQTGEVFDDTEPCPAETYAELLTDISQASVQIALALRNQRGKYGLITHSGKAVREVNSSDRLVRHFRTTLGVESQYFIDHDQEYKHQLKHLHDTLHFEKDREHASPQALLDTYTHSLLVSMESHYGFLQSKQAAITHDDLGVENFFVLDDVSISHLWQWYQDARSKIVWPK